ncbi:MAG: TlpA disulfide reductase family protein [Chitinophagales bacterium]
MKTLLAAVFSIVAFCAHAQRLETGVPFKDVNGTVITEGAFREMLSSGNYSYYSVRNEEGKVLEYQLQRDAPNPEPKPVPPAPPSPNHSNDSGYLNVKLDSSVPFKDEKGNVITELQFRDALQSGRFAFFSLRNEENKVIEYQLQAANAPMPVNPEPARANQSIASGVTYTNENNKEITEKEFRDKVASGVNYIAIKNEFDQVSGYQLQGASASGATSSTPMTVVSSISKDAVKPGNYMPAFTTTDLNGNKINSADLKGKVVLLSFWFTACQPCIDELPDMNAIVEKYRANQNVVILSPTTDDEEKVRRFLTNHTMNSTICIKARELADICYVLYYPTNVIIDKNGVVRNVFSGGLANPKETLEYNIDQALK